MYKRQFLWGLEPSSWSKIYPLPDPCEDSSFWAGFYRLRSPTCSTKGPSLDPRSANKISFITSYLTGGSTSDQMPTPPAPNNPKNNTPSTSDPEVVDLDDVIVQAADEIGNTKVTKKRKSIDPSVEIKKTPGRTCKKLRGGAATAPPGAAMQRSPAKKPDQNHDAMGLPAGLSLIHI